MALALPQLERLWTDAGGDPRYAPLMARIALRESGGRPDAKNLVGRDHSIGLWQINQLAHKGRYGTDTQLQDPMTNARAAVAVFNDARRVWKNPLKPWSTYNPSVDRKYLLGGSSPATGQVDKDGNLVGTIGGAVAGGVLGPPGAVIGGIIGGGGNVLDAGDDVLDVVTAPFKVFDDVAEALSDIWGTLTDPQTWLRLLKFVGGIIVGFLAFKQMAAAAGAPA